MKKTTLKHSKSLTKKLSKYGALSAAIAGIADASGQVVFTNITPDFVGTDVFVGLDLNNDGTFDFILGEGTNGNYVIIDAYQNAAGNSWLGSQPGGYNYPFALGNGVTISSGQATWFAGDTDIGSMYNFVGTLNFNSCYSGAGASNWCGVTDRFLGLRFTVGADVHYGWAHLDVNAAGTEFTVKGYAYEQTPGAPITTDTTLSLDAENPLEKTKVVALNKSIGLYNLAESTNYTLYNMSGQKVLEGSTNLNTYVIEANSVSSGVYIIEVRDNQTNTMIKKKIVL